MGVLKSPLHAGHLDALLTAMPGALVVHCHRQPVAAVSSYASLIRSLRGAYSERVSPQAVGRQALERCDAAMRRALTVRDSGRPEAFGLNPEGEQPATSRVLLTDCLGALVTCEGAFGGLYRREQTVVCSELGSLPQDPDLAPLFERVGGTSMAPAAPWRFSSS